MTTAVLENPEASDTIVEEEQPGKHGSRSVGFLAGLGFALTAVIFALFISQQVAVEKARNYLKTRYKSTIEVPVKDIRPDFIFDPSSGRPAPPLGFCWTVEIDTGMAAGEVMVNPWNHEVVDWTIAL